MLPNRAEAPLKLEWLPPTTRSVFDFLRAESELAAVNERSPMTLIGGTALCLQIGHRLSEDLDFFIDAPVLPRQLSGVMARARAQGLVVRDMLSPSAVAATKINHGVDLHDWVQDWAISGVKVTFSVFEGFRDQMQRIMAYPRAQWADAEATADTAAFTVLGLDGLFAAKASVLARRARSRDLFDLHTLITKHGYSVRQLFATVAHIDPCANTDHHRDVLRGLIPLDKDDEGFDRIGVVATVKQLHDSFDALISADERDQARAILRELPSSRA